MSFCCLLLCPWRRANNSLLRARRGLCNWLIIIDAMLLTGEPSQFGWITFSEKSLKPIQEGFSKNILLQNFGSQPPLPSILQLSVEPPVLPPCDDELEHSNCGAPLALPVLRVRVQPLQHVKSLDCIEQLDLETCVDQATERSDLHSKTVPSCSNHWR